MSRRRTIKIVTITPVITTSAYTANDQVGAINNLANALGEPKGFAELESLIVTDAGKQKAALTIYLFDDLPTVASSDNAALDIIDAEMKTKCIGSVQVAASDYQDVSGSSVATVRNIGLLVRGQYGVNGSRPATGDDHSLYAVIMTTGTPTYVSVSDLRLKFGFEQF